jgi:hypothetical protein
MDWLFIAVVGENLPKGNPDQMREIAAGWRQIDVAVRETADGFAALTSSMTGAESELAQKLSGLAAVFAKFREDLAGGAAGQAQLVDDQALALEQTQYSVLVQFAVVVADMVQILLEPYLAPLIPSIIMAGRLAVRRLLDQLSERTAQLLKAVAVSGVQAAIQGLVPQLIQVIEHDRAEIDAGELFSGILMGFAGGGVAHGVGVGLGHVLPQMSGGLGLLRSVGEQAVAGLGSALALLPFGGTAGQVGFAALAGGVAGASGHLVRQAHGDSQQAQPRQLAELPTPADLADLADLAGLTGLPVPSEPRAVGSPDSLSTGSDPRLRALGIARWGHAAPPQIRETPAEKAAAATYHEAIDKLASFLHTEQDRPDLPDAAGRYWAALAAERGIAELPGGLLGGVPPASDDSHVVDDEAGPRAATSAVRVEDLTAPSGDGRRDWLAVARQSAAHPAGAIDGERLRDTIMSVARLPGRAREMAFVEFSNENLRGKFADSMTTGHRLSLPHGEIIVRVVDVGPPLGEVAPGDGTSGVVSAARPAVEAHHRTATARSGANPAEVRVPTPFGAVSVKPAGVVNGRGTAFGVSTKDHHVTRIAEVDPPSDAARHTVRYAVTVRAPGRADRTEHVDLDVPLGLPRAGPPGASVPLVPTAPEDVEFAQFVGVDGVLDAVEANLGFRPSGSAGTRLRDWLHALSQDATDLFSHGVVRRRFTFPGSLAERGNLLPLSTEIIIATADHAASTPGSVRRGVDVDITHTDQTETAWESTRTHTRTGGLGVVRVQPGTPVFGVGPSVGWFRSHTTKTTSSDHVVVETSTTDRLTLDHHVAPVTLVVHVDGKSTTVAGSARLWSRDPARQDGPPARGGDDVGRPEPERIDARYRIPEARARIVGPILARLAARGAIRHEDVPAVAADFAEFVRTHARDISLGADDIRFPLSDYRPGYPDVFVRGAMRTGDAEHAGVVDTTSSTGLTTGHTHEVTTSTTRQAKVGVGAYVDALPFLAWPEIMAGRGSGSSTRSTHRVDATATYRTGDQDVHRWSYPLTVDVRVGGTADTAVPLRDQDRDVVLGQKDERQSLRAEVDVTRRQGTGPVPEAGGRAVDGTAPEWIDVAAGMRHDRTVPARFEIDSVAPIPRLRSTVFSMLKMSRTWRAPLARPLLGRDSTDLYKRAAARVAVERFTSDAARRANFARTVRTRDTVRLGNHNTGGLAGARHQVGSVGLRTVLTKPRLIDRDDSHVFATEDASSQDDEVVDESGVQLAAGTEWVVAARPVPTVLTGVVGELAVGVGRSTVVRDNHGSTLSTSVRRTERGYLVEYDTTHVVDVTAERRWSDLMGLDHLSSGRQGTSEIHVPRGVRMWVPASEIHRVGELAAHDVGLLDPADRARYDAGHPKPADHATEPAPPEGVGHGVGTVAFADTPALDDFVGEVRRVLTELDGRIADDIGPRGWFAGEFARMNTAIVDDVVVPAMGVDNLASPLNRMLNGGWMITVPATTPVGRVEKLVVLRAELGRGHHLDQVADHSVGTSQDVRSGTGRRRTWGLSGDGLLGSVSLLGRPSNAHQVGSPGTAPIAVAAVEAHARWTDGAGHTDRATMATSTPPAAGEKFGHDLHVVLETYPSAARGFYGRLFGRKVPLPGSSAVSGVQQDTFTLRSAVHSTVASGAVARPTGPLAVMTGALPRTGAGPHPLARATVRPFDTPKLRDALRQLIHPFPADTPLVDRPPLIEPDQLGHVFEAVGWSRLGPRLADAASEAYQVPVADGPIRAVRIAVDFPRRELISVLDGATTTGTRRHEVYGETEVEAAIGGYGQADVRGPEIGSAFFRPFASGNTGIVPIARRHGAGGGHAESTARPEPVPDDGRRYLVRLTPEWRLTMIRRADGGAVTGPPSPDRSVYVEVDRQALRWLGLDRSDPGPPEVGEPGLATWLDRFRDAGDFVGSLPPGRGVTVWHQAASLLGPEHSVPFPSSARGDWSPSNEDRVAEGIQAVVAKAIAEHGADAPLDAGRAVADAVAPLRQQLATVSVKGKGRASDGPPPRLVVTPPPHGHESGDVEPGGPGAAGIGGAGTEARADDVAPPWHVEAGALGEVTVADAERWTARRARDWARKVVAGHRPDALSDGIETAAAELLSVNDEAGWQELLTRGKTFVADGHLVWLRPVPHGLAAKPAPADNGGRREYTVRFSSTGVGRRTVKRGVGFGMEQVLYAVYNAVRAPLGHGLGLLLGADVDHAMARDYERTVISGRKRLVDLGTAFGSDLRLAVFVDGVRRVPRHDVVVPRRLVLNFPRAAAAASAPRPQGDARIEDPAGGGVARPRRYPDTLHAVNLDDIVAGLHETLRDAGLSADMRKQISDEAQTLLAETSARGRYVWWQSSGDTSNPIRVPGGPLRKPFEGHLTITAEIDSARFLGVAEPDRLRTDMGVGTLRAQARKMASTASYGLGYDTLGTSRGEIGDATQQQLAVPALAVTGHVGRETGLTVGTEDLSHTVLLTDEPEARYHARLRLVLNVKSATHQRIPPIVRVVDGELGIPWRDGAGAADFETRVFGAVRSEQVQRAALAPHPGPLAAHPHVRALVRDTGAVMRRSMWRPDLPPPSELARLGNPEWPAEPLPLAARKGLGMATAVALPGSELVHDQLRWSLRQRIPLAARQKVDWSMVDRVLGGHFGRVVLESDLTDVLAGITHTVDVNGRSYRLSVRAVLGRRVDATRFDMTVNKRALASHVVKGSRKSGWRIGLSFGGGFRLQLQGAVRLQLGALLGHLGAGRSRSDEFTAVTKAYRRMETTKDVAKHSYRAQYELRLADVTSGDGASPDEETWWIDHEDVLAQILVPSEHDTARDDFAFTHRQIREEARAAAPTVAEPGGADLAAARQRLVDRLLDTTGGMTRIDWHAPVAEQFDFAEGGTSGVYPAFHILEGLPETVAALYRDLGGPDPVDDWHSWPAEIADLAKPAKLAAWFDANVGRSGRSFSLPTRDGWRYRVRITMRVVEPRRLGEPTETEIEHYFQTNPRHMRDDGKQLTLGVNGEFGPQFAAGSQDSGKFVRATVLTRLAAERTWDRTSGHESGQVGVSRVTYDPKVAGALTFRGTVDAKIVITRRRVGGDTTERRETAVRFVDAVDLVVAGMRVHDVLPSQDVSGGPVGDRPDTGHPRLPPTRDHLTGGLLAGLSHVERLKADDVLPAIMSRLARHGLLTSTRSGRGTQSDLVMEALESSFSSSALEMETPALLDSGVMRLIPLERSAGMTGYLFVHVTVASVGPAVAHRPRPDVRLTLRAESLEEDQQGSGDTVDLDIGASARARAGVPNGAGGAEGNLLYSRVTAREHSEGNQLLDIQRAQPREHSDAFEHPVYLQVRIGWSTEMPELFEAPARAARSALTTAADFVADQMAVLRIWYANRPDVIYDDGAQPEDLVNGSATFLVPTSMTVPIHEVPRSPAMIRDYGHNPRWGAVEPAPKLPEALVTRLHPWDMPAAAAVHRWARVAAHDSVRPPDLAGERSWEVPGIDFTTIAGLAYDHALTGGMLRPRIGQLLRHEHTIDVGGRPVTVGLRLIRAERIGPPEGVLFRGRRYQQDGAKPRAQRSAENRWTIGAGPEAGARIDETSALERLPAELTITTKSRQEMAELGDTTETNEDGIQRFAFYRFDVRVVAQRAGAARRALHVDVPGGLVAMLPLRADGELEGGLATSMRELFGTNPTGPARSVPAPRWLTGEGAWRSATVTDRVDLTDALPILRGQLARQLGRGVTEALLSTSDGRTGDTEALATFLRDVRPSPGGAGRELVWSHLLREWRMRVTVDATASGPPVFERVEPPTGDVPMVTAVFRAPVRFDIRVGNGAGPGRSPTAVAHAAMTKDVEFRAPADPAVPPGNQLDRVLSESAALPLAGPLWRQGRAARALARATDDWAHASPGRASTAEDAWWAARQGYEQTLADAAAMLAESPRAAADWRSTSDLMELYGLPQLVRSTVEGRLMDDVHGVLAERVHDRLRAGGPAAADRFARSTADALELIGMLGWSPQRPSPDTDLVERWSDLIGDVTASLLAAEPTWRRS